MWIHVIGDRDTVIGFKLIGIHGTVVTNKEKARELIDSFLIKEDFGILIIGEKIYENLLDYIYNIKVSRRIPLIIEVPDRKGARESLSMENVIKSFIGLRI